MFYKDPLTGELKTHLYKAEYKIPYEVNKKVGESKDEVDTEGNPLPIYELETLYQEFADYTDDKELFKQVRLTHNNIKPEDIIFSDVILTKEEQQRFEEVKYSPESAGFLADYIKTGSIEALPSTVKSDKLEEENLQLSELVVTFYEGMLP